MFSIEDTAAHVAAYYNRAYFLMLFPLQQINGPLQNVMLPVLSSLREDLHATGATFVYYR